MHFGYYNEVIKSQVEQLFIPRSVALFYPRQTAINLLGIFRHPFPIDKSNFARLTKSNMFIICAFTFVIYIIIPYFEKVNKVFILSHLKSGLGNPNRLSFCLVGYWLYG